jgi:seryl-tRNA synthetase
MAFTDWLVKIRLQRTERRLRSLRARQRQIRDKEEDLQKEIRRGAASEESKARAKKLHDEKEHLTHEINQLHADEERYKAELEAAGATTH